MSKIVIFGILDFAQLANYYLQEDPQMDEDGVHEVVAFSVHQKYITKSKFEGKPVVPFEEVEKLYPSNEFKFFAPMSGAKMNKNRELIYNQIKQKGYSLISYVSSKATKFNNKIGDNCFILEDNTIQPFVEIGNNVVIWSGNHLGHHSKIHSNVLFTSHVVLSGHCIVDPYSWFGVNSTISNGIHIAEGTLVAMSSCITKNTEPYGVYMGLPAKKIEGKNSMESKL